MKADLLRWDAGATRLLIKDVSRRPLWARWWGRWQLAREAAVYRHLAGVDGVPAFCRRIDRDALALARVGEKRLIEATDRFTRGARHLARLRRTVEALHARGVAHLDLRGRHNVVVDDEGRATIVDFGAAVRLRPGGLLHRILFDRLARVDRTALLKWQRTLLIGPLDRAEQRRWRADQRRRALWPFNVKRRGAP